MLNEALQIIHNKQMNEKARQRKVSMMETRRIQTSTKELQNIQAMTKSAPQLKSSNFSNSITVHKLRESKWFKYSEAKIFLSVVENGFIVEKRNTVEEVEREWGIALWEPGKEKSKDINHIHIYCLIGKDEKTKVCCQKLEKFWSEEQEIRINNQHDKEKVPNNEDDIRKQIEYALKSKTQKWHNTQHFTYFCRYEKPIHGRIQQISERVKWNSIGVSLGMLMRGRNRRPTASK